MQNFAPGVQVGAVQTPAVASQRAALAQVWTLVDPVPSPLHWRSSAPAHSLAFGVQVGAVQAPPAALHRAALAHVWTLTEPVPSALH